MKNLKDALKALSCGFLLDTPKGYLMCHPSGKSFKPGNWDIPKGHIEDGETPLECAKRELFEETGIVFDKFGVEPVDMGEFEYTSFKNLHIFYARVPEIDARSLECTTYFAPGRKEIDAYIVSRDQYMFFRGLNHIIDEIEDRIC